YLQWWLKDSTLAGNFELTADRLNVNEFMGSEEAAEEETTEEGEAAEGEPMEVIEIPGNIDFRMKAIAGEVLYDNLVLKNVKGAMPVHDKRVDLQNLSFHIFDGAVVLNGAYDVKDKSNPLIEMGYAVKDVDIQQAVASMEMIQQMAPIAKTAFGKFSTDLEMTANLDQHMEVLMNTIAGEGTLRTKNVRVEGFQPLVDVAKALKVQELQNTNI